MSKNIVLCFDGTENQFGPLPYTNVLKVFKMLDKTSQSCYYQPGIGVGWHADCSIPNYRHTWKTRAFQKLDAAAGTSFGDHVKAGYKYIIHNYNQGDKIYLFGFSRGAFTARVLAGMMERVGLLQKGLEELITMAFEIYSNWEYAGQPSQYDSSVTIAEAFKSTFLRMVSIEFMGLWDSINSIGMIRDKIFPYTASSGIVEHVRHAVSIDERRAKYKPVLFDNTIGLAPNNSADRSNTSPSLSISKNVVEVWFAGNHGDLGGGWPADENRQCLSDIPFRWMLVEILELGTGSSYLKFKSGEIELFNSKHPIELSLLSYNHDLLSCARPINQTYKHKYQLPDSSLRVSSPPSLSTSNSINSGVISIPLEPGSSNCSNCSFLSDTPPSIQLLSYSSLHPKLKRFDGRGDDPLKATFFWWILEILPFATRNENKSGRWSKSYEPNFGRSRKIPKNATIHWSVYYRMKYVYDYSPTNLPKKQEEGDSEDESMDEYESFEYSN